MTMLTNILITSLPEFPVDITCHKGKRLRLTRDILHSNVASEDVATDMQVRSRPWTQVTQLYSIRRAFSPDATTKDLAWDSECLSKCTKNENKVIKMKVDEYEDFLRRR
jgi:hypothetical protein